MQAVAVADLFYTVGNAQQAPVAVAGVETAVLLNASSEKSDLHDTLLKQGGIQKVKNKPHLTSPYQGRNKNRRDYLTPPLIRGGPEGFFFKGGEKSSAVSI